MIGAIINVGHLVETAGYPLLFVLVMSEYAGVPIPGETALITAAVLASEGKLDIGVVIPIAAVAAIAGDGLGYLIGHSGGRWLLERPGAFHRHRQEALEFGEPFFQRHGAKAVFLGRFVLGLRVWASWLAGATRMRWNSFLVWNVAGGITWATLIGLLGYALGRSAGSALEAFAIYGLAALLVAVASVVIAHRRHRHRRAAAGSAARTSSPDGHPPDDPGPSGG